jgi:hypothetical protein
MSEHHIDEFFREYLHQESFSFASESSLASMHKALIHRKRLLLLKRWGGATVITSIAALLLYWTAFSPAPRQQNNSNVSSTFAFEPLQAKAFISNALVSVENTSPQEALSKLSEESSPLSKAILVANNSDNSAAVSSNKPIDDNSLIASASNQNITSSTVTLMKSLTFSLPSTTPAVVSFDPAAGQLPKLMYRHSLSVYGGMNISQSGWSQGANKRILGTAGIEYAFAMSGTFSLHAGLGYRLSDARGISSSSEQIDYGFGKKVVREQHETSELHFVDMPFDIRVASARMGYLFTGVRFSFLANVKSNVLRSEEVSLVEPNATTSVSWGDKSNFKEWNAGLRLGYGYSIGNRWSAEVMADIPLQSMLTSEVVQGERISPEYRAVVKYKLYKF